MVHGPPGAQVCEPCIRLLSRIMDREDSGGIVGIEDPIPDVGNGSSHAPTSHKQD
jgi:hypothetical protein